MKPRALLMVPESRGCEIAFITGLQLLGYDIGRKAFNNVRPDDVLILWNRKKQEERLAQSFEQVGAKVLIAENGYLGKQWNGGTWYAVALGQHAGAGQFTVGGPERWDGQKVNLAPWRDGGTEIVVLGQRGVGSQLTRQPDGWHRDMAQKLREGNHTVRERPHPGTAGRRTGGRALEDDLAHAWAAVTWASGAAIRALVMGIPVFYGFPQWIGAPCSRIISPVSYPVLNAFHGDRLEMFRRLIWAQWEIKEIANGTALRWLLKL